MTTNNFATTHQYLLARTNALAKEWGITNLYLRVTNRQSSCAQRVPGGWRITYGKLDIIGTFSRGMYAYSRAEAPLLQQRGLGNARGRQALDILAAHEFAHVLVGLCEYPSKPGPNATAGDWREWNTKKSKPHGPEWQEIYGGLLDDIVARWDS